MAAVAMAYRLRSLPLTLSQSPVFFFNAYKDRHVPAMKASMPSATRCAVVAANVARYAAAPVRKCSPEYASTCRDGL